MAPSEPSQGLPASLAAAYPQGLPEGLLAGSRAEFQRLMVLFRKAFSPNEKVKSLKAVYNSTLYTRDKDAWHLFVDLVEKMPSGGIELFEAYRQELDTIREERINAKMVAVKGMKRL